MSAWDEAGLDPRGEGAALRRLWRAVLGEQLKLVLGGTDRLAYSKSRAGDRAAAHDWMGSADFEIVCTWAGYDPDVVREIVQARRADPEFDMRAYWRIDRRAA